MTDTCVLKRKLNNSFENNDDIKFSKMNHMKTKKKRGNTFVTGLRLTFLLFNID